MKLVEEGSEEESGQFLGYDSLTNLALSRILQNSNRVKVVRLSGRVLATVRFSVFTVLSCLSLAVGPSVGSPSFEQLCWT